MYTVSWPQDRYRRLAIQQLTVLPNVITQNYFGVRLVVSNIERSQRSLMQMENLYSDTNKMGL